MTRSAISPRLAIRTLRNMSAIRAPEGGVEGEVRGRLDAGRAELEFRRVGGVLEGRFLRHHSAAVEVHETLVEGLHSVLGAPLGDQVAEGVERLPGADAVGDGGGVEQDL